MLRTGRRGVVAAIKIKRLPVHRSWASRDKRPIVVMTITMQLHPLTLLPPFHSPTPIRNCFYRHFIPVQLPPPPPPPSPLLASIFILPPSPCFSPSFLRSVRSCDVVAASSSSWQRRRRPRRRPGARGRRRRRRRRRGGEGGVGEAERSEWTTEVAGCCNIPDDSFCFRERLVSFVRVLITVFCFSFPG